MKKQAARIKIFLLLTLLSCFGFQAKAGHTAWAELTYNNVGPGVFLVNLKMYRDCGGPGVPNTYPLTLKAPGCNNGRTITMTKTSSVRIGEPYCAAVPNTCTVARFNFEEHIYSGTLTFTAAEKTCQNWILSWEECCRPATQNVAGNGDLYAEAQLKLLPNVVNNSPQFGQVFSPFVHLGQPVSLNHYATDADGDSLVYRIERALSDFNTPIPYANFATEIIYNHDSTKFAPLNWTFTNALPIVSYTIDWTPPMPNLPVKYFNMNPVTGTFNFTPMRRKASPLDQANKYTLITQVDEYRKINGVPTIIGSVRRDMYLTVIDGGTNQIPALTTATANGVAVTETDVIHLKPGTALNFQFGTTDANPNDVLTIASDAAEVMPGAVFTKTTTNQPAGTISWTPAATHIRDQLYYFHVRVSDNACPVKGFQIYTFGVKVSATGAPTGVSATKEQTAFTAFPNPYSEEIYFNLNLQTKAESIQIYNLLGRKVAEIPLKTVGLGVQKVPFAGANKLAAGTYVAKLLCAEKQTQTMKFTKIK